MHIRPYKPFKFITTKSTFVITLLVIALTSIGVGAFGVGQHKTLFQISLVSTSILSTTLFLFLSIGLFVGIKLKDNMGNITGQKGRAEHILFNPDFLDVFAFPEFGADGVEGTLISIGLWIAMTIAIMIVVWLVAPFVWELIIVFIALLYWIFFRALRIVFKKSGICKGSLIKSVVYGLTYTILYSSWVYGVILCTHYLLNSGAKPMFI